MTLLSPRFSGRALTVRNPWPFAIRFLDKDIENRGKPAPDWLVGADAPWISLHTGCHVATAEEWWNLGIMATEAGWDRSTRGYEMTLTKGKASHNLRICDDRSLSPMSEIPGVFRITSQDAPYRGPSLSSGWRVDQAWGYHIEYRPFPSPIPCTGPTPKPGKRGSSNLGWWRTPDAVTSRIAGMLAEVCGG